MIDLFCSHTYIRIVLVVGARVARHATSPLSRAYHAVCLHIAILHSYSPCNNNYRYAVARKLIIIDTVRTLNENAASLCSLPENIGLKGLGN